MADVVKLLPLVRPTALRFEPQSKALLVTICGDGEGTGELLKIELDAPQP